MQSFNAYTTSKLNSDITSNQCLNEYPNPSMDLRWKNLIIILES